MLDYDRLSRYLKVLAEPSRLLLLHKLQLPHAVSDIALRPSRVSASQSADRIVSRRNVESHLARLDEVGLVHTRDVRRDGRPAKEYLVNHGRLFVVIEELRRLSLIQPPPGLDGDDTQHPDLTGLTRPSTHPIPVGPTFIVVGGPLEGRSFSLHGDGPWTIGRSEGNAVSLPYDPFVSGSNSEVHRAGDEFLIRAREGARNGTRVNWRVVDPGTEAPLVSGDIIGIGRSSLVFRRT